MTLRVVKVGTSLLRERPEASTAEAISKLSASLAECMAGGDRLVLVSSGAVGLGCQRLGMERRPVSLTGLQAAAAIGQGHLMSLYEEALAQHSIPVAQVLLTRADLADRRSYRSASATLISFSNGVFCRSSMKTTRCHLWNCGSATTTPSRRLWQQRSEPMI